MRPSFLLFLFLLCMCSSALAGVDLSVVVVRDVVGRPMSGAYASTVAEQAWRSRPGKPAWTVEMHFTVSKDYPYSTYEIGRHQSWPLSPDTVRVGRQRHLRFTVLDCWCVDQYLLVMQDGESMRVDMPNDENTRDQMVQQMARRSGTVPSPVVIRFRPGRFSYMALAQESELQDVEQRIADRLVKDARKEPMVRAAPSLPMPARTIAAAPQEERSQVPAQHSGSIRLVEQRGDTLVLRVTGEVMLDGGCASNRPMMAVEVNVTHDNWLQLASTMDAQMDCGLSTTAWKDHELRITVVEWMQRHGREGLAVMPGRYRMGVRFADGAVQWTKAFTLR
ncbi:MAG: hypothetical protein JNL52_05765 [Flavobacteriales bacterium]|nr:hypothetical protein [Flavobacteriales bacterium]